MNMFSSWKSAFRLVRLILYLATFAFSIWSIVPVYFHVSWLYVLGSDHVFEVNVNCGAGELVGKYTLNYEMGTRSMVVNSDYSQGILFVPDGGCKQSVKGFKTSIAWHYDDFSEENSSKPFQEWLKNCKDKGMVSFVLMISGIVAVLAGVIYRSYNIFSSQRPNMTLVFLLHFLTTAFLGTAVFIYYFFAIKWENEATEAQKELKFQIRGGLGYRMAFFSVLSFVVLVIIDIVVTCAFPDVSEFIDDMDDKNASLLKHDSLNDVKPNVTFNVNYN